MKAYFLLRGLHELAAELTGTERIYLGIRPYGFHAGNMLPFVVFPTLLCREVMRQGRQPRFHLFVFINDWEQDRLAGPHTRLYPFNIFPMTTTFQYAANPDDPTVSIVDYWEPVIRYHVKAVREHFPALTVTTVRNSAMKTHPAMKRCVLYALRHPHRIAEVLRRHTQHIVLGQPLAFALAVCPQCRRARGTTVVEGSETVVHQCRHCATTSRAPYESFDYWFYHKPLAVPRLEAYDIDLCITGLDHYHEGDFSIRQELIQLLGAPAKFPRTLYTPILLGRDGETMGKTRGNAELVAADLLCRCVAAEPDSPRLQLPADPTRLMMSPTIIEEPFQPVR